MALGIVSHPVTLQIILELPLSFFLTMKDVIPKWAWVGFAWAFCVIYAQVYVGIHYPLDVIGGAIIGIIIGSITGKFFARRFGFHAIPLSQ